MKEGIIKMNVRTISFTDVWEYKGYVSFGITFESEKEKKKYDYEHGLLLTIKEAEAMVTNIQNVIKELKKEAK